MTKETHVKILKKIKKHPNLVKAYVRLLKTHTSEEALALIGKTFFKDEKYD